MRVLWRPTSQRLTALVPRYLNAALTYPEVGATASSLPAGYHHVERQTVLGHGDAAFRSAATTLLGWDMHRRAGMAVAASAGAAQDGVTSVMSVRAGPAALAIPCRVVWAVDEPARQGFAYGTLPGHPECGEEAFLLDRDHDEAVLLTIRAFSRPANPLVRLGGPVPRLIQTYMTTRYERALLAAVRRIP